MPRVSSLLIIIIIFGLFVYKQIYPVSFKPDINEIYVLPADVKTLMDQIFVNKLATPSISPIPLSFKIPILLYHYVEYVKDRGDSIRISLNIEPDVFDAQVKTLKDAGYSFVTPSDIPQFFSKTKLLPLKAVILTFDDGYRDFYNDVFPILKKYQARAVAYIVPGFLDKPNNLTHWQLRQIAESGLVEIGAHTVDHSYLQGLDEKRVKFEVEQSKIMLERELKIPVVSFAYPYGAFDLKTIEIVEKAGFKTAVSSVPGSRINIENLYFMPRLRPGWTTGDSLLALLRKGIQ